MFQIPHNLDTLRNLTQSELAEYYRYRDLPDVNDAVRNDLPNVVDFILSTDPDAEVSEDLYYDVVYNAQYEMIETMFKHDPYSIRFEAALDNNDLDLLKFMLELGVIIEMFVISNIIGNGEWDKIDALLDLGVDLTDALTNSAAGDYLDQVKALIKRGVKPNHEALDHAFRNKNDEMIELLLEYLEPEKTLPK